jgi:hypothetical protein
VVLSKSLFYCDNKCTTDMKKEETCITSRNFAMVWWNKQSVKDKEFFSTKFFNRPHHSLTGREIEQIWESLRTESVISDTE